MKSLTLAALILATTGAVAQAGVIERACIKSDRRAASKTLCGCIQKAADVTLSNNDQRLAAKFFSEPHMAQEIRQSDKIGNLAPGMEADIVVIDLASTPAIAQRNVRAGDIWEAIFPTIMMGDDRATRAVWVGGRLTLNQI